MTVVIQDKYRLIIVAVFLRVTSSHFLHNYNKCTCSGRNHVTYLSYTTVKEGLSSNPHPQPLPADGIQLSSQPAIPKSKEQPRHARGYIPCKNVNITRQNI